MCYTFLNGRTNYSIGVRHKLIGAKAILFFNIYTYSVIATGVATFRDFCRFQLAGFVAPKFLSFSHF